MPSDEHAPSPQRRAAGRPEARRLPATRVPTLLFPTAADVDRHVALAVEGLIRERNSAGLTTVLGLPTGSTPIGVYRELIRLHREEDLDFANVVTFNLDEYWPMPPDSPHSYRRWMHETFFDHVNVPPENVHIPRGDLARNEVDRACVEYERAIAAAGGIDLQLLGIGRTGHVGFNEPGSTGEGRTRFVTLDPLTRRDAADGFYGEENVPLHAVTMGVGTILDARKLLVMAVGDHKAEIVQRAVEGDVTPAVPATFLQRHGNVAFAVDRAAAQRLTAVDTPWLCGSCDWTDRLEKKAVVWLSRTAEKPLLKLETRDLLANDLHELYRERGPTEAIRTRVFQGLMDTLCDTPGGPDSQTVLVFSPHPDDDVISMGGTLVTLAAQGHDVHIAYQTSGNVAVFDGDAGRHLDFVASFLDQFELPAEEAAGLIERMKSAMADRRGGDPDGPEVLAVKGLIRRTEATEGARAAGVPADRLHFLDLPFYRTGTAGKKPVGEEDVRIVADLLRDLRPAQVYVAGDLSDPHGTHRLCARAVFAALRDVRDDGLEPELWLYRGAWQEYAPHQIDRAVPLSPEVTQTKKLAIFKHESQKDRPVFPGHDAREFWVRAEHRTKHTAKVFNDLGLPEFFALEAFARGDVDVEI